MLQVLNSVYLIDYMQLYQYGHYQTNKPMKTRSISIVYSFLFNVLDISHDESLKLTEKIQKGQSISLLSFSIFKNKEGFYCIQNKNPMDATACQQLQDIKDIQSGMIEDYFSVSGRIPQ
jgi:hypothetical protein